MSLKRILDQCEWAAAYRVVVEMSIPGGAVLSDERGNQTIFACGQPHALYCAGQWMAEALFADALRLTLTLLCPSASGGNFHILLQSGRNTVKVASLLEPPEVRTYHHVSAMTLSPNRPARVFAAENRAEAGDNSGLTERDADECLETRIAEARRDADDARVHLEAERQRNETLQNLLAGRVDELREKLTSESALVRRELAVQMDALQKAGQERDALHRELADIKARVAAKQEEISAIQREIDDMSAVEELRSLDVESARRSMDELQSRYQADKDTLRLMGEEPFLKGKTWEDFLNGAARELENAEARIGKVIRLREQLDDRVQKAILTGDGTLPLDVESGE